MKKKVITVGDREWVIAELNTAQVEDLMLSIPDTSNMEDVVIIKTWADRMWKTIVWSLNNAEKMPTVENPLGSTTAPYNKDRCRAEIGNATAQEFYAEILKISGLRVLNQGETVAAAPVAQTPPQVLLAFAAD